MALALSIPRIHRKKLSAVLCPCHSQHWGSRDRRSPGSLNSQPSLLRQRRPVKGPTSREKKQANKQKEAERYLRYYFALHCTDSLHTYRNPHAHINACITCKHSHVHPHACMHIDTQMYAVPCTHSDMDSDACTHTHVLTRMDLCVHTRMHTIVCTCSHKDYNLTYKGDINFPPIGKTHSI